MKFRPAAVVAAFALVVIAPLTFVSSGGGRAGAALPAITCDIVVPPAPLTAAGLATPYVLEPVNGNTCQESNLAAFSAFVQAAIVAPTGAVTIYSPLVISAGTAPAAPPVVPVVPVGSTVGIWFGFNGVDLHLIGPGVEDPASNCVNGLDDSDFGQFAACNAVATFAAADALATTTVATPTPAPVTVKAIAGKIQVTPTKAELGITRKAVKAAGFNNIMREFKNIERSTSPADAPGTTVPTTPTTVKTTPTTVPVTTTTVPKLAATVPTGLLVVPPLGTELDGQACPSVASYDIVDQDPADNLQTKYLVNPVTGATAQNTAENRFALPGDTVLSNPSDNGLMSEFVLPAIGCHAWMLPNAADPGSLVDSLFADQLQAQFYQAAPAADVELEDEMVLDGTNNEDPAKDFLYRASVDEPVPTTFAAYDTFLASDDVDYCIGLDTIGTAFLIANEGFLVGVPTPIAGASNLFTFLANRLLVSMDMVLPAPGVQPTCAQLTGIQDPVTVTVTGGIVTAATINAGGD